MGNRMWSQIQSALRNLRHTQQDRCKEVPWNGHSHASLILLARPPRLKAHIPLQSSPSSLDPRRAREFSANHGGNA